jgi:phage recombination protein Bet
MSTEIQVHNGNGTAPYAPPPHGLTDDKLGLLQRTICKGGTPDEFELFVARCRQTGLDPFSGQIMAIMRYDARTRGQMMTIQVGIHGLRLIAERSECYAPGDDTQYEYSPDGSLLSARACVKKWARGQWHTVSERAYWEEYVQTKDGKPVSLWATKPHVMLGKCAEALALRRAFPQETSGLYIREEMMQDEPVNVTPPQSAPRPDPPAAPRPASQAQGGAPAGASPCTVCGKALTPAQTQLSVRNYGAALCPTHQREAGRPSAPAAPANLNGAPAGGDPFGDDYEGDYGEAEPLLTVDQDAGPGHAKS